MTRPFSSLQRLSPALLSRGATRISGTDWWGVLVELGVVVLGILIAFQLDSMGQAWQARNDEQALLQRIEAEAKRDLVGLREIRDQHIESAANYRKLARAVAIPAARIRYDRGGTDSCNLLRLPAIRRYAAGALAQGAGERGDLVSDPGLRDLLRRAQAERAFNDSQLTYFRDNFLRYGEVIEPHMKWRFVRGGDTVCRVDVDRLGGDPAAVAILPKLFRDQRRFAIYRQLEVQATEAILVRLSCLRDPQCND